MSMSITDTAAATVSDVEREAVDMFLEAIRPKMTLKTLAEAELMGDFLAEAEAAIAWIEAKTGFDVSAAFADTL